MSLEAHFPTTFKDPIECKFFERVCWATLAGAPVLLTPGTVVAWCRCGDDGGVGVVYMVLSVWCPWCCRCGVHSVFDMVTNDVIGMVTMVLSMLWP